VIYSLLLSLFSLLSLLSLLFSMPSFLRYLLPFVLALFFSLPL
jgi:hypothetical protein